VIIWENGGKFVEQNQWLQPKIVNLADMTFGRIDTLMPEYDDIPKEFKDRNNRNKWTNIVDEWFFKGLPQTTFFSPKDGIDTQVALRHVNTIIRSYIPKHEHKIAAVGYLLSLWFNDIVIPKK
jgi:hypothetical protein